MKDAIDLQVSVPGFGLPKEVDDVAPTREEASVIDVPVVPATKDVFSAAMETPGIRGRFFREFGWVKSHVDPFRRGRQKHEE